MTCVFSPSYVFKWKTRWVRHNRIFNQHMSASVGDALHWACRNGQTDTALELIDRGAEVSAKNNDGDTPLHCACRNGHTEIVQILIARGADISAKNNDGETPLHWACGNEHRETVLALIDRGAEVSIKDKF